MLSSLVVPRQMLVRDASRNSSTGTEEKGGDKSRRDGGDKDLGEWHGREAQQMPGLPRRRWQ